MATGVLSATACPGRLIVSTPDRSHAPAWKRASGTRRRPVPAGSPWYCRRSRLIGDVPARKYIRPPFLLENDRTELAGTNRTSDTSPPPCRPTCLCLRHKPFRATPLRRCQGDGNASGRKNHSSRRFPFRTDTFCPIVQQDRDQKNGPPSSRPAQRGPPPPWWQAG